MVISKLKYKNFFIHKQINGTQTNTRKEARPRGEDSKSRWMAKDERDGIKPITHAGGNRSRQKPTRDEKAN